MSPMEVFAIGLGALAAFALGFAFGYDKGQRDAECAEADLNGCWWVATTNGGEPKCPVCGVDLKHHGGSCVTNMCTDDYHDA